MPYANALPLVLTFSVGSLFVAWWLARWVLKKDTGTAAMQEISNAIKLGAEAFLRRQNGTIAILALLLAALIFLLYGFVRSHQSFDPVPTALGLAFWTTLSFVLGASCSVFAGYVGMWISIRSNIRTASAARTSLNDALRIALRGGAVSGLLVVSMSLLGVGGLYWLVRHFTDVPPDRIPLLIVGYGFGASFVALFAQLGGGIYTKAADVGADLVGKVEAGIPEDDPRNPAVIADLVGDNVGDCAGMAADIFESSEVTMVAGLILGLVLVSLTGSMKWIIFPFLVRGIGVFSSMIGTYLVRGKSGGESGNAAMSAINKGFYTSAAICLVAFALLANFYMHEWRAFLSVGVGILLAIGIDELTKYFTDPERKPVKDIARSSTTCLLY